LWIELFIPGNKIAVLLLDGEEEGEFNFFGNPGFSGL